MSKLTLDALKQRADAVASKDLLSQISGGQQNDCHDEEDTNTSDTPHNEVKIDATDTKYNHQVPKEFPPK